jgi:2-polyprenyl-6-methoxyphenol hydroxylase-like FAD-dependent oxidoreductase
VGEFGTLYLGGVLMPRTRTGLRSLMLSRPLLEGYIRELVSARANVTVRDGCTVRGLVGDQEAVRGIEIASTTGRTPEIAWADLVVDASGRGSRIQAWLKVLGVAQAQEEILRCEVTYSSCIVRRKPEHLGGQPSWIMTPVPPETRFGAAQAIEDDRMLVALTSYSGDPGASTYQGFIDYARSMKFRGLDELLTNAEPLSEPVQMRDVQSRWRRFDKLDRFPPGLVVVGDALCNFNPAYGQGMSVAALEALALRRCLAAGHARLGQRFFGEAAAVVKVPWSLATGADLQWPTVRGRRTLAGKLLNAYVARLMAAAGSDPQVADTLLRVMHLVLPPSALFRPRVLWKAASFGSELTGSARYTGSERKITTPMSGPSTRIGSTP